MELSVLKTIYQAIGSDGLVLIVLIWLLIYIVTKINPRLEAIKLDSKLHTNVVNNNTEAVKEMSRSNDNVASALKLLNQSITYMTDSYNKHDKRSELIENEVIKIRENTRNCLKK